MEQESPEKDDWSETSSDSSDPADSSVGFTSAPVFEAVVADLSPKQQQAPKRCTPEVRTLATSAVLYSSITSCQIYAAHVAHSQALMVDCISSSVDAFTFMGNIVVECKKRDGRRHAGHQLLIVGVSLSLLCFFTVKAMVESWSTVQSCRHGHTGDEDDVNGWITLAFALGNIVFDLICLASFYKSHKKTGSGKHVNMFSAFLHVAADFLRAATTLALSLLILTNPGLDSGCMDAYASMLIGVTILGGALVGVRKWLKLLMSVCRG